VTIPDVVCVIDSGLVKETRYKDHSRMTLLANTSVSKASAKQRAGRAGRVQAGVCFRLYTRAAHAKFLSFTRPEIQRVPLEDLCLHVLSSTEDQPFDLLSQALDPPAASAVTSAVKHLDELGALESCDDGVQLTTLGRCMARLPLDVHLSKLLIVAVGLDCLEDALTVAAAMSYQSPFVSPFDKRDAAEAAKKQFHPECLSDSLAVVNAYNQWQHLKQSKASSLATFCRKNFLHSNRLQQLARARQDLRRTLASALPRLPPQSSDQNSPTRLRQALVAALAPQIARQDYQESQKRRLSLTFHQGVAGRIHPSSLTTGLSPLGVQQARWLAYQSRMETTSSFALECSVASPLWLALFGRSFTIKALEGVVVVDG
jgi:HrpA-like RNA helicase